MRFHHIPVQAAEQVAGVLWPAFEERDGYIFLAGQVVDPHALRSLDRTGAEAVVNHVHVLDLFAHAVGEAVDGGAEECWYDRGSPDFLAACSFGRVLAQTWFAKLGLDYPHHRFRVYYTERDNPVVRFHRVRDGEPVWLDEADWPDAIANGELLVLDTHGRST